MTYCRNFVKKKKKMEEGIISSHGEMKLQKGIVTQAEKEKIGKFPRSQDNSQ